MHDPDIKLRPTSRGSLGIALLDRSDSSRSEGTVSALVTNCEVAMGKDTALAQLVNQCRMPLSVQPPPLYTVPKPLTWI